jgi:hypothetical protein
LHSLVLVVRGAVDLHHDAIVGVAVVPVVDLAIQLAADLVVRLGQPVCSLHVPDIPPLQGRVDAILCVLEGVG